MACKQQNLVLDLVGNEFEHIYVKLWWVANFFAQSILKVRNLNPQLVLIVKCIN